MRAGIFLLSAIVAILAIDSNRSALRQAGVIDLPGVAGRIDHMAVDSKSGRLFVAALGNNSVEVIDLSSGKRVQSLPGFKEPQGVVFVPELNRLVVASGEDGASRVLDGSTFKVLGTIGDLEDADNVRYDEGSHLVYVGYGSGALAIIDLKTATKAGEIKLDAHPESFQLEKSGSRIFVNVPQAGHVAVVDRKSKKVIAKWPLNGVAANFPMGLDEANHRLFIGCRRPAKLLVLDTESGRQVAEVPCVSDTDDLFYDVARKRIYISGGGGFVTVIQQTDADHYSQLASIETAPGARTSIFVAELGSLYVAAPKRDGSDARLIQLLTTDIANKK